MAFYTGAEFPEWESVLLIGGLVSQPLLAVYMESDRAVPKERIPMARVRDVKLGPVWSMSPPKAGADSFRILSLNQRRHGTEPSTQYHRRADRHELSGWALFP